MAMNKSAWVIVAVIAIVAVLFAGLLPLPGQKDNVTPHSQPAPSAAVPPPPVGPAEMPATGADALKQSSTK